MKEKKQKKDKFDSKDLKLIWSYMKPYKMRVLAIVLVSIPIGFMDSLIALALKPYMDVVLVEKSVKSTGLIPLAIVSFAVFQGFLRYSATYLNTWVGGRVTNDMKATLFNKLMAYDAGFFDRSTSGKVQFRFNNDVNIACNGLITNGRQFLTKIISSVALVGVLFYNSWQLACVSVVVLILALVPLGFVRRRLKTLMNQNVISSAQLITHYNEAFSGNRVVTSYNLYDHLNKKFKEGLDSVFGLSIKMTQRTGIVSPLMHTIVSIGIAAVIWMGSYLIVSETITPGNFVSFLSALLMLYTPIKSIGNNYNSVQMSLLAIERIREILEDRPQITNKDNAISISTVSKDIVYKNVKFEYVQNQPVLKNINLEVKAGETVAFVGNSGGGKTTLVNLLPRFYDVTSGSILLDGHDVKDIELESLRENISIVFQDNFLFAGTIRENIVLGLDDISEQSIYESLDKACLLDFVKNLKLGLETEIGERGITLSGGQKQRLAIARAFLKNAPVVILDEATSSLDNKSEAVVQKAIENLMQDRTVFIIAHRLSTVQNANRILVVSDGEIVEQGTHSDLIAKKESTYSSLYKTQIV